MELILLSVFGIACLFALELCGLLYARWVREPHLTGSDPPAATTVRAITKQGGIAVHGRPGTKGQIQCRWVFVDDVPTEREWHCRDAANDAVATTSHRLISRDARFESSGE